MSRDWLEEHQIAFYFAAVVAAAIAGMYAMFLQIPFLASQKHSCY